MEAVVNYLYQRKRFGKGRELMQQDTDKMQLFYEYYRQWIDVYKKGAIREATMSKYLMTQKWVEKLVPELKVSELTRTAYQKLLNDYAKEHERQTTLDFHHQLKGAVLDAVDEGLLERDPTRKAIIKGKSPRAKKIKYLNQFERHTYQTLQRVRNIRNFYSRTQAYARIAFAFRRRINCQCSKTSGACQHDDNAENVFAHYSGT